MTSRRVAAELSRVLEELTEAIEQEEEERLREDGMLPDVYQAGEFVPEMNAMLRALIEGKTHWLDAAVERPELTANPPPDFYLEYQNELAQILVARMAIADLENTVRRLQFIPTLVLAGHPPMECRALFAEAAHCYTAALFRASVSLSRAALEAALEHCVTDRASAARASQAEGKFAGLIMTVKAQGRLTSDGVEAAHLVRKCGNTVLHGGSLSKADSERALISSRRVLEELFR